MSFRRLIAAIIAASLLASSGCAPKDADATTYPHFSSAPDVTPIVEALTAKMKKIAVAKVSKPAHVGRPCVIVAKTPDRRDPPPPPIGMVRLLGPTVIYSAQLHDATAETLEIRAEYPSSGNLKVIVIPREDIESVYLGG